VVLESKQAAEKASWLALLGGAIRTEGVRWLSSPEQSVAAENKVVQLAAAARIGVRTPRTVISTDPESIAGWDRVVVKPLGPGDYVDSTGQGRAVFTSRLTERELSTTGRFTCPFIFQEEVAARTHYRVVTVGKRSWYAALDARGLPVDWRATAEAHESFEPAAAPEAIRVGALDLCNALAVGFSSQDWVVDFAGEAFFLDLNPAGQWMFLPRSISEPVTNAIADWLGP
jgi:glutathione synthase/RimK-type ligase-like ATP-grasp enzyme